MDNLSWRMMSMNLKKQQEERTRYVQALSTSFTTCAHQPRNSLAREATEQRAIGARVSAQSKPRLSSQPSGIAQQIQRKASEKTLRTDDSMNLDDFIMPHSVASPAARSRSPSTQPMAAPTQTQGIHIQRQKHLHDPDLMTSRASAPSIAPFHDPRNTEFGYVPRRVRKTSVDERQVCLFHIFGFVVHNSVADLG